MDGSANMSESRTTLLTLERPRPDSPASTVRAYLTAILHQHHGVTESEATRIAAAWKVGRGAELMSYDVQTFRDLFGSEVGMLLFTFVQGDSHQGEAKAPRIASQRRRTLFEVEPGCK
jgi:hypothetical protein